MLRETLHTVLAACQSVSLRFEPLPEPPVIFLPRPVWDNGTNYDIPTFIRRRGQLRRLGRYSRNRWFPVPAEGRRRTD